MNFFKYFTPISYWLLTVLWLFIFIFYINRIKNRPLKSRLFITLLTILAIDSFRTLFESLYFGAWYTSLVGFIPKGIHDFLIRPENVFIPKIINVVAAVLIISIVLRKWIPEEVYERNREIKYKEKLKKEIEERKRVQDQLTATQEQLEEAQELASLGYYVFHIQSGQWSSSLMLNEIFGIDETYEKNVESWANLIHPEDKEMMIDYLENKVIGKHENFDKEYRIINQKSGETKWVWGKGNLKFDSQGKVLQMLGAIQDITERKKTYLDLEQALNNIKVLSGLVPICANCKNIRDDKGYWNHLETYLEKNSDILFSHGLCPKCAEDLYGFKNGSLKDKK